MKLICKTALEGEKRYSKCIKCKHNKPHDMLTDKKILSSGIKTWECQKEAIWCICISVPLSYYMKEILKKEER